MDQSALYQLIVSQLRADGYESVAASLAKTRGISGGSVIPSNQLMALSARGLQAEIGDEPLVKPVQQDDTSQNTLSSHLDMSPEQRKLASAPEYRVTFGDSHKDVCTTACFSSDGKLAATGSLDSTLKILDGALLCSAPSEKEDKKRVLLRLVTEMEEPVHAMCFHPHLPILAAGSTQIRFIDVLKPGNRTIPTPIQDSSLTSLCFHPSGEYIFAGAADPTIRIYNVSTSEAFASHVEKDYHTQQINELCVSHQGRQYASCSADGDIKVWDMVSSRCVMTIPKVHAGENVFSVSFSLSDNFLLSNGGDHVTKLLDLRAAGNPVLRYEGVRHSKPTPARFNFNETFIYVAEQHENVVAVFDAGNGSLLKTFAGHNGHVTDIAAAPTTDGFITCCTDSRFRFWSSK